MKDNIILYGSENCHKTLYYKAYLTERNIGFTFKDVIQDNKAAIELRNLHKTRRLNFPTFFIKDKKLRNPNDGDLEKHLGIN